MIIRKVRPPAEHGTDGRAEQYGAFKRLRYSDVGGLTQFGAAVETLQPGSRSSERHWHEAEDEFLYVISGEATVVEEDGAHLLHPGDAACCPARASAMAPTSRTASSAMPCTSSAATTCDPARRSGVEPCSGRLRSGEGLAKESRPLLAGPRPGGLLGDLTVEDGAMRTSENSVMAKFAAFFFDALE
jgi:uncharacterized RmlC-like cupin family protein